MYNQPFFIPNYMSTISTPTMMRGLGAMRGIGAASRPFISGASTASKGLGLMGKLGNGLSVFRSINWSGLINNTSKTLGIVNQTIPLVRQVGPIMNNMRSMLKLASVFKDETDKTPKRKPNINYQNNSYQKYNLNNSSNIQNTNTRNSSTSIPKRTEEENSPTFFIPT